MCGYLGGVLLPMSRPTCTGMLLTNFPTYLDARRDISSCNHVLQVVYSLPHVQLHWLRYAFHFVCVDMLLPTLHHLCNGLS
jgi:hypothetical protein